MQPCKSKMSYLSFRPMRLLFAYLTLIFSFAMPSSSQAHDGYELWLRYAPVSASKAENYVNSLKSWSITSNSATAEVIRKELTRAFPAMLGKALPELSVPNGAQQLLIVTLESSLLSALAPQLRD